MEQKEAKQATKLLGTNQVPQNIKTSQARLASKVLGLALAAMDSEEFIADLIKNPKELALVLETFRKLSNIPTSKPEDTAKISQLAEGGNAVGIAYRFESNDDDDDLDNQIAEGDFYALDEPQAQHSQRLEETTNKKGIFSHAISIGSPIVPKINRDAIPEDQSPANQSPVDLIEDGETDDNRQRYDKIIKSHASRN